MPPPLWGLLRTPVWGRTDDCTTNLTAQRRYLDTGDTGGHKASHHRELTRFRSVQDQAVMELRFREGDISTNPNVVVVIDESVGETRPCSSQPGDIVATEIRVASELLHLDGSQQLINTPNRLAEDSREQQGIGLVNNHMTHV